MQIARRILNQPALDDFNGGELSPGLPVSSDDQILAWVARDAETALHPSCTCRLGTDDLSVVDPATMRVHGLKGLRVVDASVMPYVTNGNIYAPVMMIAEKAADMILGNTPLAPEHVGVLQASGRAGPGQEGEPPWVSPRRRVHRRPVGGRRRRRDGRRQPVVRPRRSAAVTVADAAQAARRCEAAAAAWPAWAAASAFDSAEVCACPRDRPS